MDISVLLALDTAAFQQGLKAATDALGQFKAGADVCFEAIGKAQAQIDAAADAAAKEAAKVTEAAEAARAKAEAELEAAKATAEASQSSDRAAASAGDLSEALQEAKGGLGVVNGTAAMASGSLQGMAGGAMQAANGFKMLGASMRTAMMATGILAAVAAVAALTSHLVEAHAAAEDLARSTAMEEMRRAAERSAQAYSDLCDKMERAAGLARALNDVDSSRRRQEQDRKLAELERDRNRELAAGGDAAVVNRRYDERRRELEFSFKRQEAGAGVSDVQRQLDEAQKRLEAVQGRRETLAQEKTAHETAAAEWQQKRFDTMWSARAERYQGYQDEEQALADKKKSEIAGADREIAALSDTIKVLTEKLEVARGVGGIVDIQTEAARLAASIPEKPAPAPEPTSEKSANGSLAGSWGSLQTASDRLARIGGFVGGSNMVQNQAREQLQVARSQLRCMEQIERNTAHGGQEAAILA